MRRLTRSLLWLGSLAIVGCSTTSLERTAGWLARSAPSGLPARVELDSTPFFPQREYQCGPAALATVLVASGVATTADELVASVYLPARRGTVQTEMVAATRARGRLPYVLPPEPTNLLAEVAGGRPVVVLQKFGAGPWPGWHYAVVIGYDTTTDRVFLRSGTERRLEMSAKRFLWSWERAGSWALLALPPAELPALVDSSRYIEAAAGLEATGRAEDASVAYRAASSRWPDLAMPHLGLGNLAYARRDFETAATEYRAAIDRDTTDPVARHNLAEALRELGCPRRAAMWLEQARTLAGDGQFAATIAATAERIAADPTPDRPGCVAW